MRRRRNSRPSLPTTLATCPRTSIWPARDVGLHRYLDGANQAPGRAGARSAQCRGGRTAGRHLADRGNSGRAAAEFHQLLTFAPQDYEAHFGLGLIAAHQGRTAEAAEHFRAALAANPHSAEAHYQLGLILEAQNQKKEAVREFKAALQIDPKYKDASRELAKLTSPTK